MWYTKTSPSLSSTYQLPSRETFNSLLQSSVVQQNSLSTTTHLPASLKSAFRMGKKDEPYPLTAKNLLFFGGGILPVGSMSNIQTLPYSRFKQAEGVDSSPYDRAYLQRISSIWPQILLGSQ